MLKRRCRFSIRIILGLALLGMQPALAQTDPLDEKIAAMTTAELEKELSDAELFNSLVSAQVTLDGQAYCGAYRDEAVATKEEVDRLNQIQNKTTENYSRLAQEAKEKNTQAVQDYLNCYGFQLPYFPRLKEKGIVTYQAHSDAYGAMAGDYTNVPDIGAYILKLRAALEGREMVCGPSGTFVRKGGIQDKAGQEDTLVKNIGTAPDDVMAVLRQSHRTVEVLPGGRGDRWRRVCRGYKLRVSDNLRTGPRARARLEFMDRDEWLNAGPTVVNVGSNTEIHMEKFNRSFKAPTQTTIQMLRGYLRAIAKNLGPNRSFRVRTGASLCGIRGTEVAISYSPATDDAQYILDHGDAFYEVDGGAEVTIEPRTAVRVLWGQPSAPRPVSEQDWQGLVAQTEVPSGVASDTGVTAAPMPSTATNSVRPAPVSPPTSARAPDPMRARAGAATAATRGLIEALKAADPSAVYYHTSGGYHDRLNERTNETGNLRNFLKASKQRPLDYDIGCTSCDSSGQQCWTWVDLTTVSSPVDMLRVVFISGPDGSATRVFDSRMWSAETERAFDAMGSAYCE